MIGEEIRSSEFGPNSTNPRHRRAYAHAVISNYKRGEATYGEAFEAAFKASHTRKGQDSKFGRAVGGVFVDGYAQRFDNDTVVVSGLSPAKHLEVALNIARGGTFSYSPDAYMLRSDANNTPQLKGFISDPIEEGYSPLK